MNKIKFTWFFLVFIGSLLSGMIYGIHLLNYEYTENDIIKALRDASDDFSSDPIIVNISDYCRMSDDPIKCVFDEIPAKWNYVRDGSPRGMPLILPPQEFFGNGGVCRDVTVLRYSAFTNLGIYCNFNLNTPNHVYLLCYDGEKVYELNNEYFFRLK